MQTKMNAIDAADEAEYNRVQSVLAQRELERYKPITASVEASRDAMPHSLLVLDQFSGPEELRAVIRAGKPQVKSSSWLVHFVSRYASIKKKT